MRFGAVFRYRKSYGAVRCCDISYGAVRRGSPLNGFFYGAAPLSVGKTVQHRLFSTVHRMNKPYKTAVSNGSRAFSRGTNETAIFLLFVSLRCTVLINKRCKPAGAYGFLSFFTSINRQSHQQQQILGALKIGSINRFVHTHIIRIKTSQNSVRYTMRPVIIII